MRLAAPLAVLLAACSQSSPQSSLTSSTPSKTPGVYAVMVKDFYVEGGPNYTVSLVGIDGRVAAASTLPRRTVGVQIGSLSTTTTTLYYLVGDSEIRFLRPDGYKGITKRIALGPNEVAAFAVSPDDRRVAVSVLDFTRYPVSSRLFVEDLHGSANHVELYPSRPVLEWPVGWHSGSLVMAVVLNVKLQNPSEGFLRGDSYYVADPQTGARVRVLCEGGHGGYPESPAGTICQQFPNASVLSWDGASRPVPLAGSCALVGPLSPRGVIATRFGPTSDGGCRAGEVVFQINANGTQDPRPLASKSSPEGWIDSNYLVLVADRPAGASSDAPLARSLVDVASGATARIQAPGFFAAALPGGL
jgi:hypothetical protein